MRIRGRCFALMILILSCLCMSCTGQKNGNIAMDAAKEADKDIAFYHFHSLQEEGVLFYGSDLLYVIDYTTGASAPVCNRLNCDHVPVSSSNPNPTCYAAYNGTILAAFLYHDRVYVFVTEDMLHTMVYSSERTGEGRRKVAEADFIIDTYILCFDQGRLYFTAQENTVGDNFILENNESYLCTFDVESADFRRITEKTPDTVRLNNVLDGKVYFTQIHVEGNAYGSTGADVEPEWRYLRYHETTGEVDEFLKEYNISNVKVTSKGIYYCCKTDKGYEVYLSDDQGREFLGTVENPLDYKIVDEKLLFSDMKNDLQKYLVVVGVMGERYMVLDNRSSDEYGGDVKGFIMAEDYWSGNDVIVYVGGGQR